MKSSYWIWQKSSYLRIWHPQPPGYFACKINMLCWIWCRMHLMPVYLSISYRSYHTESYSVYFDLNLNFLKWVHWRTTASVQWSLILGFNIIFHLSCWSKERKCKYCIFIPATSWKGVHVTNCLGSNSLYVCT